METTKTPATLPQLLKTDAIQQRFNEILGKNSPAFISALLAVYKDSDKLKKCDPNSIIAAAGTAAILNLNINPQLGYAYIIPYGNKATFQIGYKGLLQLAIRSGLYKTLNSDVVYEGQIKDVDFATGKIIRGEKVSDKIVGYIAYMELLNGFKKSFYMTKAEMEQYALKYSDSYRADKNKSYSVWAKNFDNMAKKTVLKKLLTTYAPLSIDMQDNSLANAIKADQAVVYKDNFDYVDNTGNLDAFDAETGEILTDNDAAEVEEPVKEIAPFLD